MRFRWLRPVHGALATLRAHPWDVVGCMLAVLYALPTAWYPFGSDQGIHWYLGHRLLQGEMPYASGISGKPPVIFVVHALAETLFGNRQSSIRILEIVALPFFGYLLAKGIRRPTRPARDGEVGTAALLLSAANFTFQDYWNTAHPEFYMTLALCAALAVAVHDVRARRRALAVGALCMVGFLLKYPGAAMAIPIAAYSGVRAAVVAGGASDEGWSRASWAPAALALVREAAWFLVGAAAVFAACVLPFVLTGTVREMYEVCVLMTENYAGSVGFPERWYRPILEPTRQGPLYATGLGLATLGLLASAWRRDWRELGYGLFLLVLAAAAVGSVVLQKRLFTYHWIATYAFVVLLALWGLRQVVPARVAPPLLPVLATAWAVAVFLHEPRFVTKVPHTYREHVTRWASVVFGDAEPDTLRMTYHRKATFDKVGDLIRAADEVRRRAQPGDAVCLATFISPIYQLSGMNCTMRHAIGTFTSMGPPSWREEYDRHLRDNPPRFMVSVRAYTRRNKQLMKHGYRQIARYGTVVVYEHPGVRTPG